jgi:hypothetical protein
MKLKLRQSWIAEPDQVVQLIGRSGHGLIQLKRDLPKTELPRLTVWFQGFSLRT